MSLSPAHVAEDYEKYCITHGCRQDKHDSAYCYSFGMLPHNNAR